MAAAGVSPALAAYPARYAACHVALGMCVELVAPVDSDVEAGRLGDYVARDGPGERPGHHVLIRVRYRIRNGIGAG